MAITKVTLRREINIHSHDQKLEGKTGGDESSLITLLYKKTKSSDTWMPADKRPATYHQNHILLYLDLMWLWQIRSLPFITLLIPLFSHSYCLPRLLQLGSFHGLKHSLKHASKVSNCSTSPWFKGIILAYEAPLHSLELSYINAKTTLMCKTLSSNILSVFWPAVYLNSSKRRLATSMPFQHWSISMKFMPFRLAWHTP